MIESSMFTCPETSREKGIVSCDHMRQALQLLNEKAIDCHAKVYIKPLQALLDCHEASLWAAVDFHGLQHLDDHYISCSRTAVLLEGVLEEIELPEKDDTGLLRELLSEAIDAARQGGRPCRVSRPGSHLGLSFRNEWENAVAELEHNEEDSSS